MTRINISEAVTPIGLRIVRTDYESAYENAIEHLIDDLDYYPGCLFASSFEYPGRYTRFDMGFCRPPLEFSCSGRRFEFRALNERGRVLVKAVAVSLADHEHIDVLTADVDRVHGEIVPSLDWFPEELRSKQPSVFSVLRQLISSFSCTDPYFGFYGAFGYELAFQFEAVSERLTRTEGDRDLVLFLPDDVFIVDHRKRSATRYSYEYDYQGQRTTGLSRDMPAVPYRPGDEPGKKCDHGPGEYAQTVRAAIEAFRRGDLFEVVPGQVFREACNASPSTIFRRLKERNPAPYGALVNLGQGEYLVAASPEMFVRVEGNRIETCPISGTIARGKSAIEDAEQIRILLNSEKEESELTMCTDVDRNDKSRVCEPGSVKVIGRRQIEMYSRLIHTVDHVEGRLRKGFDALDGFLAHAWAVTVTGAPKQHAIQFIEDHERSPRRWYGGAIGFIGCDGNMNTGLTLRTVQIRDGVASVRAGATLLFESEPDAEEAETRLKASALLDAILRADVPVSKISASQIGTKPPTVLMVDHEDSFVHTLAGYFRRAGAEVVTFRSGFPEQKLTELDPQMVLLSPGPGRPQDFGLTRTIELCLSARLPVFGVCLGLQGIVEYFGGELALLPKPMHGKPSEVLVRGGRLFEGMPRRFTAGRYHSLYAVEDALPGVLEVTASTETGIVMGIEHRELPISAVQFHPESLMSLKKEAGLSLVRNVLEQAKP